MTNILTSDALFTTEEDFDDERDANRRHGGYDESENPFAKKKAVKGAKRTDKGGSLISVGTLAPSKRLNPNIVEGRNKLFGPFDMGKIVGEDEILLKAENTQFSESDLKQGVMLAPEDKREGRKKEIEWQQQTNTQAPSRRMDEEKQDSASKHQAKERERKQQKLMGMILSQSIIHNKVDDEEIELVIEDAPKQDHGFSSPTKNNSMFESSRGIEGGVSMQHLPTLTQSVNFGAGMTQSSLANPGMASSQTPLLAASMPHLFTAGGGMPALKRPVAPLIETSPLKGREDLFRVLKRTTKLLRPGTLTDEDAQRLAARSELPDQSELAKAKEEKKKLRDDWKEQHKLRQNEMAQMVALEEGALSEAVWKFSGKLTFVSCSLNFMVEKTKL